MGLLASLFVPVPGGAALWISGYFPAHPLPAPVLSFIEALVGAACGGGILWLFAEGYFRLRHREGMGMGDVKMLLMAGSFLGWQDAVLTILLASVIGSVVGLIFSWPCAAADATTNGPSAHSSAFPPSLSFFGDSRFLPGICRFSERACLTAAVTLPPVNASRALNSAFSKSILAPAFPSRL